MFTYSNNLLYLSVVFEPTGGFAGSQIPQTKRLVPGAGQSIITITGQHNVRDKVRVSIQTLLRDAVVSFVPCQLPDNQSLVYKYTTTILKYYLISNKIN